MPHFLRTRGQSYPLEAHQNIEVAFAPIALSVCILHMILVFPVFFPNLRDIGRFDEAHYIEFGKELTQGILPQYSASPLATFFYALTYLPVQTSPYWLIHSCTIGRFLLFGLLWFSSSLIARQLSAISPPLVMVGLLVISPALSALITNGSHALFAVLSSLAFWKVLSFHDTRNVSHLWLASLFVALSALARGGEGAVLLVTLLGFSLYLGRSTRGVTLYLLACITPFAIIVGGYVLSYVVITGKLDLGTSEYFYLTFEQGHGLAFHGTYSQNEARQLFGAPEDNQYSVITAIRHSPEMYVQRIPRLFSSARWATVSVYGGGLGLLCLLLAVRGALELAAKKLYSLLLIFLSWPMYGLLYILIVHQPTHFLLPFYVILSLASIGLAAVVPSFDNIKEYTVWLCILLGLIIMALIKHQPIDLPLASAVFLLGLWIVYLFTRHYAKAWEAKPIGIILILVVLLTQRGYPAPKIRTLGIAPDEMAGLFMREYLKPHTPVGANAPIHVWMANMAYVPMHPLALSSINSEQALLTWIADNKVEAIYVDKSLRKPDKAVWKLLEGQVGKSLEVAFTSDDGDVQVLFVTTRSDAGHSYVAQ